MSTDRRHTPPFRTELKDLADEIGLTLEQRCAVERLYEQTVDDLMDTCIEIVADEETDR